MFRQKGRLGTQWFMLLNLIVVLPGAIYFLTAKMPYEFMHLLVIPYLVGGFMICAAIQIKVRTAEDRRLAANG